MSDYEGSRSEFLKILAECGEVPAFIERARAPQLALDSLLASCEARRAELLRWPALHLTVLALKVRQEWHQLRSLLAVPQSVVLLEALYASLPTCDTSGSGWFTTNKSALGQFLESAERFNRNWQGYIENLDLEAANRPRREFNQYYALEKACAFGNETLAEGFEPLEMISSGDLLKRFALLSLPRLA